MWKREKARTVLVSTEMMETGKPLTEKDLPDLSAWKLTPILSLQQAAFLWGGIDPAFTADWETAKRVHPQQYQRAYIAQQAFLGGIVQRTLTAFELVLCGYNYGDRYVADQKSDRFSIDEICPIGTLVLRDVITEWARREQCLSIRQVLQQERRRQNAPPPPPVQHLPTPAPEPVRLIEYQPYQPTHENPALVIAMQLSSEIWDKQQAGVRPPKQLETQEFIRKRYRELTGVEPLQAEIDRIDRIARPPRFKNQ